MALLTELSEDNPWWKSTDEIMKDYEIVEWKNSSIKWEPRLRFTFDTSKDLIYSLRGPRQIGKTTLIKLQIKDFLEKGISPWNIMYYAFDIDNTPKELVNLIKNYLDNTKRARNGKRCYLFLDEISSIKNWQRGIKRLWDQRRLENCSVIATGSHTVDLKISTEKLPGRRGETSDTLDKIMLPMKFSEYVSVVEPEWGQRIKDLGLLRASTRLGTFNNLRNGIVDEQLESLQSYLSDLNRYLIDYLLTGGIPKVVNEYVNKGTLEEGLYTTYLNAILGDMNALNRNETIFRQLIQNVLISLGWPASWRSLKKDTDIGNMETVARYVDTLERMFVLTVFYQYNHETKRAIFQKEKKIHFHDPFIFHTLNGWCTNMESFPLSKSFVEDPKNQGGLVEGLVGDHLIRLAFNLSPKKQTFVYSNSLFHWRYAKYGAEREVDYIFHGGIGPELPIEVKFQNSITVRDIDGIVNFKKQTGVENALLLSKNKLEINRECVIIPTAMFLLLI